MTPLRTRPDLSIILVCKGGLATLQVPLPGLRAQTVADRIELVIVAERGAVTRDELDRLTEFHSVRLVEQPNLITNRGRAGASAIADASAPFVAFHENHTRAMPETFERILSAFGERTAAVGPSMRAANSDDPVALAMYALSFSPALPPVSRDPQHALPYQNATFRKTALATLAGDVAERFMSEADVHAELITNGFELRTAEHADIWHINEARPRRLVGDSFWIGRRFGHARSTHWPLVRRLTYAVLFPVIASLTWWRLVRALRRTPDARDHLKAAMCWATVASAAFAMGEVVSYLSRSIPSNPDFELHELHIVGRLNGRTPQRTWLAEAVAALPKGTL